MNIVLCHSTSSADKKFVAELKKHLSVLLINQDVIKEIWSIEDVPLGDLANDTYKQKLQSADICIPFLSPDYLSHERTHKIDIPCFKAIIKNEQNVIPLLIRECLWKKVQIFSSIKIFPNDEIAIDKEKIDLLFKEFVELVQNQIIIKDYKSSSSAYDKFYSEFKNKFFDSDLIFDITREKFNYFPKKVSYLISSTIANEVVLPAVLKWKKGFLKTGHEVNEEIISKSDLIFSSMKLNDQIISLAKEIILEVLEGANELISQFKTEKQFSGIPPNFNLIVFFAKDLESDIIDIANNNQVVINEFVETFDELRMDLFYSSDYQIYQISKLEIEEMTNSGSIWMIVILFLLSLFLGSRRAKEIGLKTNVPRFVRATLREDKIVRRVNKIERQLDRNIYGQIHSKKTLDKFSRRIHFAMIEILNEKIEEIKACG